MNDTINRSTLQENLFSNINEIKGELSQYIISVATPPNDVHISQKVRIIFKLIEEFIEKPKLFDISRT